jgi:hypothetical protein
MIEIKDPGGLMKTEFKCPLCGSSFFRTVDTKNMIRLCSGKHIPKTRSYTGCTFKWDSKDDHKYFHDKEESYCEIVYSNKD